MTEGERPDWTKGITRIVQDPIRFKLKLDIGEEVYTSLRMKKYFLDALDAGTGAFTGVGVATSTTVASTFFAPAGFLGAIGIGAAATPVGWAVTAGIIGAGLSVALGKYFVRGSSSRVRTVPDFINTPLDILALGLFDSIAMLSVKVATIDGEFADSERNLIKQYFSSEWGYDLTFIEVGLSEIEKASVEFSIKQVALNLAEFKKRNPDCNYSSMAKEIIRFLTEISEADGVLDEREEMAVERVKGIFDEVGSFSLAKTTKEGLSSVSDGGRKGIKAFGSGIAGVVGNIKSAGANVASKLKKEP
ncbi:TerB family tellurite resistance protein [Pseudomonadota bacterium]